MARKEEAIIYCREILPIVEWLYKTFQSNQEVHGDAYKRLYNIAERLKKEIDYSTGTYSSTGDWDKIVGSPEYSWNSKSTSSKYTVTPNDRSYIERMRIYLQGIIQTEDSRKSNQTLNNIVEELSHINNRLNALISDISVVLPIDERLNELNENLSAVRGQVVELKQELVELQSNVNTSYKVGEQRDNHVDVIVDDLRNQMDEIRKQQSSLLALLAQVNQEAREKIG